MIIHIITFHVPFPANYGGAIDVYYKLKALYEAGYKVILHTFLYDGERSKELSDLCYKVYYYKRTQSIFSHLTFKPYIVQSRKNNKLIKNLLLDEYPILFEGLHTCYYLDDKRLMYRKKYVRTHNIEHEYYRHLFYQTTGSMKKMYYFIESLKLKRYEKILNKSDRILAISQADYTYFNKTYKDKDVRLLRCFFDFAFDHKKLSTERYILYHGNLEVQENISAVLFILTKIIPLLPSDYRIIIAGRNPSSVIFREVSKLNNAELIPNPDDSILNKLISLARINLLLSFQSTGIKLKLLNTLVKGKGHCVVNKAMVSGNDLSNFCTVSNTEEEIANAIKSLIDIVPSEDSYLTRRQNILKIGYNDISSIVQ